MEQFTERLSRLAELSPEELEALEAELVAAFDVADEAADLDTMESLADAIDSVREALGESTEAEVPVEDVPADVVAPAPPVEMAASAETAEEPVADEPASDEPSEPAVTADATSEETTVDETPEVEAPAETPVVADAEVVEAPEAPAAEAEAVEAPAEAAAEEAAEEVAEAVEAGEAEAVESDTPSTAEAEAEATPEAAEAAEESEEQVTELTAADVPEVNEPVAASVPNYVIRAGGDIPNITAGSELADMDAVTDAMTRKVNAMRGVGGDGEHVVVASFTRTDAWSEERTLKPGDMNGNAKKIRDFLAEPEALTREALVATAWCAPRTPIYDVPTVGTTERPVRDALPSFNAERGGITWIAPPGLPDLSDATSLWRFDSGDETWKSYLDARGLTETDPVETKPCLTIPCGPEKTADVDAIPVCFCFDNLSARAFPEWVRANTELVLIGQARFAEQVLLSKMYAVAATGGSCTEVIETSVGVARDFILTVATAAAAARWRLRLGENAPLQLLAPAWVRTAIAVDLGLQAPGDNTFTTSVSAVDGYFAEYGIDPIWHIDDVPGDSAFDSCAFPTVAEWMLFPTGSFLRLDTGELNLGVVRTKEDVQKNKYCEFSETFETVAYTGPDSPNGWITKGATNINLLGGTGAPIDLSA